MNKGFLAYITGVFVLLILSCHIIWEYVDLPQKSLPISFIARLCTPLVPLICMYLFPFFIASKKRKIEPLDMKNFSFWIVIIISVSYLVSLLSIKTDLRKITSFGKLRQSLSILGYSIESDILSPVDQILSLRSSSDEEKIHLLQKIRPYYIEDTHLEQSLRTIRTIYSKQNRWENLRKPVSSINHRNKANIIYNFLSKKRFHQALREAQNLALETSQDSVVYRKFIKAFRKERFFLGHYLSRQPIFDKEFVEYGMVIPMDDGKKLHIGQIYRYDNRCFLENWMIEGGKSIPYGLLTKEGTILLPGDTENYEGVPLMVENDSTLSSYVYSSELQHSQELFPYMIRTLGELLWYYKSSISRLEGLEGEWNYKLAIISKPFWIIIGILYSHLHITLCSLLWSVLLNPITVLGLLLVPFCIYWWNHLILLRIVSIAEGYWGPILGYSFLYIILLCLVGAVFQQIARNMVRVNQSHCNRRAILWLKSR